MTNKADAVDMSRAAITARLEDVRQLYRLGMSLFAAGRAAGLHREPASTTPKSEPSDER